MKRFDIFRLNDNGTIFTQTRTALPAKTAKDAVENSVYGDRYPATFTRRYFRDAMSGERYGIYRRDVDGVTFMAVPTNL